MSVPGANARRDKALHQDTTARRVVLSCFPRLEETKPMHFIQKSRLWIVKQQSLQEPVVMRRPSVKHHPIEHRFATATARLQASFMHNAPGFAPGTAVRPSAVPCGLSGLFLSRQEPTTTPSKHRPVPSKVSSLPHNLNNAPNPDTLP